ncbi:hypothetical protein GCM10023224_24930 [Streptomonospora halophila]|uniref:Nucleotidyl transferase AbiEii toxin, Type IV TA system n=1 Tax=Streptomonospora halophila TaxID=427369 RepID=A0ABP9GPB9_9ACTN
MPDLHSADGFWRELNARVRDHAHGRGTSPRDEMLQWVLQRTMVRLFGAYPDDWTIKGGQTLLARWPEARATSDVDVVTTRPTPVATMIEHYNSALDQDFGDHLRFTPVEVDDGIMGTGTAARITHSARLGDRPLMEIQTDIVPPDDRPEWRGKEMVRFPEHILASGVAGENPDLRMISPYDTLAHKVSGMFIKTWRGEAPVRVQDLVDTLFLSERLPLDGPEAHAVLREEFAYQRTLNDRLIVSDRFEVPNPAWHEGFARYAASTPGLGYSALDEAVPAARAFLDPLLADEAPQADWDPQRRAWIPRGEAEQKGARAIAVRGDFSALDNPVPGLPGPKPASEAGPRSPGPGRRPHQDNAARPDPGYPRRPRSGR